MLVLSRQRDETIMIGDDIEITVVDIRGDKVRLGIAAPSRIAVHRKEVYESIRRENEAAAQVSRDVDISPLHEIKPGARPIAGISPGPERLRVSKAQPTGSGNVARLLSGRGGPQRGGAPGGRPPDGLRKAV